MFAGKIRTIGIQQMRDQQDVEASQLIKNKRAKIERLQSRKVKSAGNVFMSDWQPVPLFYRHGGN